MPSSARVAPRARRRPRAARRRSAPGTTTRPASGGTSPPTRCRLPMPRLRWATRCGWCVRRPAPSSTCRQDSRSSSSPAGLPARGSCAPPPTATSSWPRPGPAACACCGRAGRQQPRARTKSSPAACDGPFGIAFYPADNPQWVYVGNTDSVVRFAYRDGDLKARGAPETIVAQLPTGGHSDARRGFLQGRIADVRLGRLGLQCRRGHGPARSRGHRGNGSRTSRAGAAWGNESERADVLVFDPQGKGRRIFATGIRNCVGLAVNPTTGDLWCSTNERDGLGDNLPPDYITRVREGGFYGWPWYYMGAHEDPRHARRASRSQGQDHGSGRDDPAAFGVAAIDVLHRRPVPGRAQGQRVSRPSTAPGTGRPAPATRSSARS